MAYQTINPYTEKLVQTFAEQSHSALATIIERADDAWRLRRSRSSSSATVDAVMLAKDAPFGPGATVMSRNTARASASAGKLEAGMVFINRREMSAPHRPLGGIKSCGFGRELADLWLNGFVNKELVHA